MSDELLHAWTDDPAWQESIAAWFLDLEVGVGGFFRWGAHPNEGYGRMNLFAFEERGRRFRRVRERVPLDPAPASSHDLVVASCVAGVDDAGLVTFRWEEPECAADLRCRGFYPVQGFGGRAADDENLHADVYTGHLECSGTVEGTVRVGDRTHEVHGLGHRDRSWGPRRIDAVHTNRMFSGTVGPALSFACNEIQTVDGTVNKVGFVVRDGVVSQLADFELLPAIHLDGYSVASGTCRILLPDDEILHLEAETVAGQLTPFDAYLSSDHISRVRWGDLVGMCDNELTNNPRLGTEIPRFLQYVDGGDGLSDLPARTW